MTEERFGEALNRCLNPSGPVQREEALRGRQHQLRSARESLALTGRQIFIWGDKGVGKTSLAMTAAHLYQSSDNEPPLVCCDASSNFGLVIRDTVNELLGRVTCEPRTTTTKSAGVGFKGLAASVVKQLEQGDVPEPKSVNEATSILAYAAEQHSRAPIVVIDEFQQLGERKDRALFGDLVKQLGDRSIPLKLIFCGVGDSLEGLLADHESAFRYIANIELERLRHDALMEVITHAAETLDIEVSEDHVHRVASISDGFPHYTHLLGTKLFWRIRRSQEAETSSQIFGDAVEETVREVHHSVSARYEQATKKYRNAQYEYVMWALADHPDLEQQVTSVFDTYCKLVSRRAINEKAMPRRKFDTALSNLRSSAYGSVLRTVKRGWVRFDEPIIRGMCRLRAQLKGVTLGPEYPR